MSESEESSGSSNEEETVYKCKLCPPSTAIFTAAEKDNHKRVHHEQRHREQQTRSGRNRRPVSPPMSSYFEEIRPPTAAPPRAVKRTGNNGVAGNRGRPGPLSSKKPKVQSQKKYDRGVQPTSNDGG